MNMRKVWDESPVRLRGKLAKELGYKKEWAKLRYDELEHRGGGMLKRDLDKIYQERKRRMMRR